MIKITQIIKITEIIKIQISKIWNQGGEFDGNGQYYCYYFYCYYYS